MKSISVIAALLASVLVGALYGWAAMQFWGFYAANNPLSDSLLEVFATQGHPTLYRAIVSLHDVVVNVVVAIPAAFLFTAFAHLNRWRNLAVATLAAVGVVFWGTRSAALPALFASFGLWFDLALAVGSLPSAFAWLRLVGARGPAVQ